MRRDPTITVGAIGPSVLPQHWNYRPVERREYHDRLVVLLEDPPARVERRDLYVTVWDRDKGTSAGVLQGRVKTPAGVGALVRGFRAGKRTRRPELKTRDRCTVG